MLKIINNNSNQVKCEECGSIIEYSHEDLIYVAGGLGFICPKCQNEIFIEPKVEYPNTFFDFSDGVKISDEKVNKWVREAIEFLKENKTENVIALGSGDTTVIGIREEDTVADEEDWVEIYVAKAYKSQSVNLNDFN